MKMEKSILGDCLLSSSVLGSIVSFLLLQLVKYSVCRASDGDKMTFGPDYLELICR